MLTTAAAAIQRVMPRDELKKAVLKVEKGGRFDISAQLQSFLHANGYLRTDTVRERSGEYAIRGGIADLFPPDDQPLRIDLFGDDVEHPQLRSFKPAHRQSPAVLQPLSCHRIFLQRRRHRALPLRLPLTLFGVMRDDDPLYEAVSAPGAAHSGMEHWQPLFFDHMDTLLDYAPNAAVTLDHHAAQVRTERLTQIRDFSPGAENARVFRQKEKSSDVSACQRHGLSPAPHRKTLSDGEKEWNTLSRKTLNCQLRFSVRRRRRGLGVRGR